MAEPYTDKSYPPVSAGGITYRRGNQVIRLIVEEGDPVIVKTAPTPTAAPTPAARRIKLDEPTTPPPSPGQLALVGKLDGRPGAPATAPTLPAKKAQTDAPLSFDIMDDPIIGGKITVFVLLYGDFFPMHKACLDNLLATVPRERMVLRVGSNSLCQDSRNYVDQLVKSGVIDHHYCHTTNDRKYPVMREMYHDSERPITTKYLLWLDDDTMVDRDMQWLPKLAKMIVTEHPRGYRCFGPKAYYRTSQSQQRWIRDGGWYRGRDLCDAQGHEVPGGNVIFFISGSFVALDVATMRAANIPDPRLAHNGGDVMIGEQVHQLGHKVKEFDSKKRIVHWSSAPRRGLSEKHAGR